ncbi:MAG: polysaccharide deacetylase family protein [Gemmatimonadaceae bacterium]|nr:polysaccharide deacetylase family protein [Gemmatimonadaceae bacterium]
MRQLVKSVSSLALRQPLIANAVRWQREVRLVFMCFHRFGRSPLGEAGHDLDAVDEGLTWLRRAGFSFADLEDTVRGLIAGRLPERPSVVVTIDDGYSDVLSAVPIFAKHACPATVFLATDFLDRRAPLWWDQIQVLLSRAKGPLRLDAVAGVSWQGRWDTPTEQLAEGERLIELVKRAKEPARFEVIEALGRQSGVELPLRELPGYQPLHWQEVRNLEREGLRFGPHTHTHPVLSALSDDEARTEIQHGYERLRAEVLRPVPILAYPNGTAWSFSERDVALLRSLGFIGGVTIDGRWRLPRLATLDPFRIGRLAFPAQLPNLQAQTLHLG